MTRALVLGASGMLGHQLMRVLGERMDACGTFRERPAPGAAATHLAGVDAFDLDSVQRAVRAARPDVVLNCIGIVKQSEAAGDPIPCIRVNALFPHELAKLCAESGARLIHFSTDCVFSGRRGRYTESDIPDPVDLYGRSKLLGEVAGDGCLTLRTSIIGWEVGQQRSLLSWFARHRQGHVHGYTRAVFSGLPTSVLARLVAHVIEAAPQLSGVYHVASEPITKYELLCGLRDALGWPVTIEAEAGFKCDRSLDAGRFAAATGWTAPPWPSMIRELAAERPIYESGGTA